MPENSFERRLGLHRVIAPAKCLPQQARTLNSALPAADDEILISVQSLNVDSASFHQFSKSAGGDKTKIAELIESVVRERGKLQNPVTGSGGMLIGEVSSVGKNIKNKDLKSLKPGDKIATLVSLTLTPLHIEKITRVLPEIERIEVKGHAILFDSGIAVKIPADINEGLALAALDVCGAPAQTARLVKPGMRVAVIGGGGKSGLFCLLQAKKSAGPSGRVIALEYSEAAANRLKNLSFVDSVVCADARDAVTASSQIMRALGGEPADLVINVANVAGTEMASILSCKTGGTVYFFSMATSFTAAALGAEGVAADVNLMIGNGYASGHAELTLNLLRESTELRSLLEYIYETKAE